MNIIDGVNFHEWTTYNEQKELTNFLSNYSNSTFYYWGWNPGIYYLSGHEFPYINTSFIFFCDDSFDEVRKIQLTKKKNIDQINILVIADSKNTNCDLFRYLYPQNKTLIKQIESFSIYSIDN